MNSRRQGEPRLPAKAEAEVHLEDMLEPLKSARSLSALNRLPRGAKVLVPTTVTVDHPLGETDTTTLVVRWAERNYREDRAMREAESGCLAEFLKLHRAENGGGEAVLAFARRWGCLGLNPTLTPTVDYFICDPFGNTHPTDWFGPTEIGWHYWDHWYEEPLSLWLELSQQMEATLRIAKAAQEGEAASEEWPRAHGSASFWQTQQREAGGILAAQQETVQNRLTKWLQAVRITSTLRWQVAAPGVTYRQGDDRKAKEKQHPEQLVMTLESAVFPEELDEWDDRWVEETRQRNLAEFRQGEPDSYVRAGARPSPLWGLLMIELMTAITNTKDWYQCGLCSRIFEKKGRRLRSDGTPICGDCQFEYRSLIQRKSYHRTRGRQQG